MRRLLVIGVCVAGCGRVGFDESRIDAGPIVLGPLSQHAFIKASRPEFNDFFGHDVALSSDGSTLAVGARWEDSAATTVDGDAADNSASNAGAVYVFARSGASWQQQAYLKVSDTAANAELGFEIDLSRAGDTLVATALNHNNYQGAAYVFTRAGSAWSQQAILVASDPVPGGMFGSTAAISSDGDSVAIGAYGVNTDAGAAYVFERTGTAWTQTSRLVAPAGAPGDNFGDGMAMSGDGEVLAIASPREDSVAQGSGAVFVYRRIGAIWSAPQTLKASTPSAMLQFGNQVALSDTGSVLAVGAVGYAGFAGAAFMYAGGGGVWSEEAVVVARGPDAGDECAWGVDLTADGSVLVLGARSEASAAAGVDGDPLDDSLAQSGAAYVFVRTGTGWEDRAYLKAARPGASDAFGTSVAVAGTTIVVGATGEATATSGVAPPTDEAAPSSGAVYVFEAAP